MNPQIPENNVAGTKPSYGPGLNKPAGIGVTGRPEIPVNRMAALAKMAQAACRRNTPEGPLEDFRILPPREEALFNPLQIASHQAPTPVEVKNPNDVPNLETALPKQSCEQPDNVTPEELGGLILAKLEEMKTDKSAVITAARQTRYQRKVLA